MGREVCACEWAWGKQTHTGVSMAGKCALLNGLMGNKQTHAGVSMGREVCTCEWPRGKLRFLSGNLPDGGGLNLSRLKSAS